MRKTIIPVLISFVFNLCYVHAQSDHLRQQIQSAAERNESNRIEIEKENFNLTSQHNSQHKIVRNSQQSLKSAFAIPKQLIINSICLE